MQQLTVATGDVIRSQAMAIDDLDALLRDVETQLREIPGFAGFDRHRIDGWQCVFHGKVAMACETTLSRIKGLRYSTACGEGDWLPAHGIGSGYGPVFVAAGKAHDKLKWKVDPTC